jgi:uncharacterized membrane protein YagU involved in acid resistance
MREWAVGFTAGALAGFARLAIEELAFLARLSSLSRVGVMIQTTQRLLGAGLLTGPTGWMWAIVLHSVLLGIVGIIFAVLVERRVLLAGLALGLALWVIMNLLLPPLGIFPAVWNVGAGTFVFSLLSDLIFGLVLAGVIELYRRRPVAS